MKRTNKKGFTIVELVIVIAVIAILAAVMIPTFSGIVEKAQQSAVLQKAAAEYKEAYALALADGKIDASDASVTVQGGVYTFAFTGTLDNLSCTIGDGTVDGVVDGWKVSFDDNGAIKVEKGTATD